MSTIKCLNCGADNSAESNFCFSCGNKLERVCPACGQSHTAATRFCPNTGARLDQSSHASDNSSLQNQPIIPPQAAIDPASNATDAEPAAEAGALSAEEGVEQLISISRRLIDQKHEFISRLMQTIRENRMFPSDSFSPTDVTTAIHQLHDLSRSMFGAYEQLHLGADFAILSCTLPVLISPQAAAIDLKDLPTSYSGWITRTGGGESTRAALVREHPNVYMWPVAFIDCDFMSGVWSGLAHPLLLSLEHSLQGGQVFAKAACQSLRERFYLIYPSIEQKRRLLHFEEIKLNSGCYPESIKTEVSSLCRRLKIRTEKLEKEVQEIGDERAAALMTISPLSVERVVDACAQQAAALGLAGNPFPFRPLTETEESLLSKYLQEGLQGEGVAEFLRGMREEQESLMNNWFQWITTEANERWGGNFSMTDAYSFIDMVGGLMAAHVFLTRRRHLYFVNSPMKGYRPEPWYDNPLIPMHALRDKQKASDKEHGKALFPEDRSLEKLAMGHRNIFGML